MVPNTTSRAPSVSSRRSYRSNMTGGLTRQNSLGGIPATRPDSTTGSKVKLTKKLEKDRQTDRKLNDGGIGPKLSVLHEER